MFLRWFGRSVLHRPPPPLPKHMRPLKTRASAPLAPHDGESRENRGTLSDPDLVLDSFEKMIFRSTAENLLQQQTSDMACAVDAQASEGSLELAAAIDTFNSQHGTESLCA
ncbi:unnamed protein product [Durusdinium trenchii]|uniref:Uncharacterized protein n=1 Tax=Durusdinium trenchii TaxID=1381693 RepID=A0ABP0QT31_9DINO